jgi:hypothetical protein
MKTIKITARFATVLQALEASAIDISYNPAEARRKAADLTRPNRHFNPPAEAYLCEDGEIRFVIECADGLKVLNTFDPFISCLDDSPFTLALIKAEEIEIHTNLKFPKNMRKALVGLAPFVVM